ncbi:MAG: hypothetical protein LBB94_10315 [Clostridiales bacterium]|jgi:hypothetical protein|nr:hypothetical protein [Clostridiales bacterium]
MNYFLMMRDHPPVIVYDEEKSDYYGALERYDNDEDTQPMTDFLVRQVELTWTKALDRETKRAEAETPSDKRSSVLPLIQAAKEPRRNPSERVLSKTKNFDFKT